MMRRLIALGMLLVLAGCGGSEPAAPAVDTPAASSPPVAASEAAPGSADQPCDLLTADELNQVLGTSFTDGELTNDEARQIVTCTYTTTESVNGVDVPTEIAVLAVSLVDGQESYDTNVDLAPAYFDNDAKPTQVDGADKAYVVIDKDTDSPVIGMLVGDQFAQIQIAADGASVEQAQQLAATMAGRLA